MPDQEFIHQLQLRGKNLVIHLYKVIDLLKAEGVAPDFSLTQNSDENDSTEREVTHDHKKHGKPKPEGTPKGKYDWDSYIKFVLKTFNNKVRSQQVVEYILKANPSFKEDKVKDAVRGGLYRLGKQNEITVYKGASRSEGYEYSSKDLSIAA